MITDLQARELAAKVLKCKPEDLKKTHGPGFAFWGPHGDGADVDKETGNVDILPAPRRRL